MVFDRRKGIGRQDTRYTGLGTFTSTQQPQVTPGPRGTDARNNLVVKGIKFPLEFHAGRVVISEDVQHIKESVVQIIGTGKGEYVLKPDFGSNLSKRIFDPVNISGLVTIDIREALRKYEKRIKLTNVEATLSQAHLGQVNLAITFHLKGRSEPVDMNFALRSN